MPSPAVTQTFADTVAVKQDTLVTAPPAAERITIPFYFTLLWSNARQQFTAPFHASKKDWQHTGLFTAAIAALTFADKPIQRNVQSFTSRHTTVQNISKAVTGFGGHYATYTLAGLGVYSLVVRNEKLHNTTLLATQSYLLAGLIETVAKEFTKRERPLYMPPGSTQPRGRFHGPFYQRSNDFKSFPSGHTTVAFAAATVYAMEYSNTVVVPILSYTMATLVGLSRITENKHWATDVLVGAVLGYLSGKQVVNNYHRISRQRLSKKKSTTVQLNLQYNNGSVQPGLVYRF